MLALLALCGAADGALRGAVAPRDADEQRAKSRRALEEVIEVVPAAEAAALAEQQAAAAAMAKAEAMMAAAKAAQAEWRLLPSTTSGAFQVEYEDAQYTEYRGDQNAHFKQWHVDADEGGEDAEDARVYTLVALLAEPGAEFAGGDFEVMTPKWPGGKRRAVAWRKGDLIAFPAQKVWHRVMPTTSGLRKTLVIWCKDPTLAIPQ